MTKLEREAFKGLFPDEAIDLERAARDPAVTGRVAQALRRADLDGDGKLSGEGELHEAFAQLDHLDRNGDPGSIRDADRNGPTPLGRVVKALEQAAGPAREPEHTTAASETLARSTAVDPKTAAERQEWLTSTLKAKKEGGGFLRNEPPTSAVGVPFPKWLDIRSFMTTHGLASADGTPTSELTGVASKSLHKGSADEPRLSKTKSRVFVVHETAGEGVYASLEAFRRGAKKDTRVNMFIGRRPGDYYVGVGFEKSRSGAKRFNREREGFVSVELVTHLNSPSYTDGQYGALARAYVMASYRAGRMLQVVPHREVDRGVKNGHNDPRDFDWERFYGKVNRMLGLPQGTTYGVLPARAQVNNRRDDRTPRYDPTRGLEIYGPVEKKP